MCKVVDVVDGNVTTKRCDARADDSDTEELWACERNAEIEWTAQSDDEDPRLEYERGLMRIKHGAWEYRHGTVRLSLNDAKGAVRCFSRAVEGGHPRAFSKLAQFYETGSVIEKDVSRAVELYEKGIAKGCPHAKLAFAYVLSSGEIVSRNMARAYELYEQAADSGLAQAMSSWATAMVIECELVPETRLLQLHRAEELWMKAASLGLHSAKASAGVELCNEHNGYSDDALGLQLIQEAGGPGANSRIRDIASDVEYRAKGLLFAALQRREYDFRYLLEEGASVKRVRNVCDDPCCTDEALTDMGMEHLPNADVRRGSETGLGDTVLHIACRQASLFIAEQLYSIPEFDDMVLWQNEKGERPVDVVLTPTSKVSPEGIKFAEDLSRLTELVSTTRAKRAVCLVWCLEKYAGPALPSDLVKAAACLVRPPLRRHLEGPLTFPPTDDDDDEPPRKRHRDDWD